MCLESHSILRTEITLMEEQTISKFWDQVQFSFLFYADRRILKFLKMKCNPSNKNPVALYVTVIILTTIQIYLILFVSTVCVVTNYGTN